MVPPPLADIQQDSERVEVPSTTTGLRQYELNRTSYVKGLLGNRKTFQMKLRVTEDERDAAGMLAIQFELLESDLLSHFSGTWELIPRRDPSGDVVGCEGQLRQDILPEGKY